MYQIELVCFDRTYYIAPRGKKYTKVFPSRLSVVAGLSRPRGGAEGRRQAGEEGQWEENAEQLDTGSSTVALAPVAVCEFVAADSSGI
ncbi:hypothetical protein [Streptomyces cahuitamycinicus]|uniref:hypothetical protein n=1 Tax=Streptomyces cahuitamycinicus TaxID=2070367 RepID=UPI001FE93814|nr:hypothetical protein [Streptomyces cahuitamycinicus]